MKYGLLLILAVCLFALPLYAQHSAENKQEITSSDIKKETREAASATGEYLHQKKERYQRKAEDKLHSIETKVRKLYEEAENKGAEAKKKISASADTLRKKADQAKEKLKDLKASGEDKWDKARAELDSMIKDLDWRPQQCIRILLFSNQIL